MATAPGLNRNKLLSYRQTNEEGPATPCCEALDAELVDETGTEVLAGAFKAIGHPVRIQILEILTRQAGQVCVCDIESKFDLSQPTISHHLRVLRRAGLLASERSGTWIYYSVRKEGVGPLRAFVEQLRDGPPVPLA